jgi:hypothetical protein
VLYLTVIDQEFQRKQVRFAGHMPLHTAIFRRADSSQKVKCAQMPASQIYILSKLNSAQFFVGQLICSHWQKSGNIFDENRKWG